MEFNDRDFYEYERRWEEIEREELERESEEFECLKDEIEDVQYQLDQAINILEIAYNDFKQLNFHTAIERDYKFLADELEGCYDHLRDMYSMLEETKGE